MRPTDRRFRSACKYAAIAAVLPLLTHCGENRKPEPPPPAPRPLAQPLPVEAKSPFQAKERSFEELDSARKAALAKLEQDFRQTTDRDRKNTILDRIESEFYGEEILGFLEKLLSSDDVDLRRRVIAMLSGISSPAALALFKKALSDPSEIVRRESVEAAVHIRGEGVPDYLSEVFEDSSAEVRLSGFDVLDEQDGKEKWQSFENALRSKNRDVRTTAIDNLQLEGTPRSLETLFHGLDSPDAETREHARFSVDFLVGQEFKTAAEAESWWAAHQSQFDKDLVPNE